MKASAGAISLPKIAGMAFGDGGVDSDGNVVAPNENQTALTNEIYRKDIDGYDFVADTTCRYECTLAEPEMADTEISEIGLYDDQ